MMDNKFILVGNIVDILNNIEYNNQYNQNNYLENKKIIQKHYKKSLFIEILSWFGIFLLCCWFIYLSFNLGTDKLDIGIFQTYIVTLNIFGLTYFLPKVIKFIPMKYTELPLNTQFCYILPIHDLPFKVDLNKYKTSNLLYQNIRINTNISLLYLKIDDISLIYINQKYLGIYKDINMDNFIKIISLVLKYQVNSSDFSRDILTESDYIKWLELKNTMNKDNISEKDINIL